MKIEIVRGDITKISADVIVNAANKKLFHGGGVALAIAKAAYGDSIEYSEICRKFAKEQLGKEEIDHGEVVWTPAYNLEKNGVKYIIHTVGPYCGRIWNEEKEEKLRRAILGALKKADELGAKSIVFPAISAGIYKCPLGKVVEVFLDVVSNFEAKNLEKVVFVLYTEKDYKIVKGIFSKFYKGDNK